MARWLRGTGMLPLVTGIAAATALSGGAVFTVAHTGCQDPGHYVSEGGVVRLFGGCIAPEDLDGVPHAPAMPQGRNYGGAPPPTTLLKP